MIEFRTAYEIAVSKAQEFYGESARDLRLEEVIPPDENHGVWDLTLGFLLPERNPPKQGLMDLALDKRPRSYERVYKSFEIDAETGALRSMSIRTL